MKPASRQYVDKSSKPGRVSVSWPPVIERAAEIVESYAGGVTLRQLFYRLVSEGLIANTPSTYKRLSALTAEGRRDGDFPALEDRTRGIISQRGFAGPNHALRTIMSQYRRDRTAGQEYAVYIGVEKHALEGLLIDWFGGRGLPVLALGGFPSQSFVEEVEQAVGHEARPAVLLYGGDFDASGEEIERDFVNRCDVFAEVVKVALTAEQVEEYNLPKALGNDRDPRAGQFLARHGALIQVELDALPPDTLRELYEAALILFWDTEAHSEIMAAEKVELQAMTHFLETFEGVD